MCVILLLFFLYARSHQICCCILLLTEPIFSENSSCGVENFMPAVNPPHRLDNFFQIILTIAAYSARYFPDV